MLYIYIDDGFGNLPEEYECSVSDYFDDVFEPEWFFDKMVKKIIETIDDSKVVGIGNSVNIYNETLGNIPPQYLSSGCKGLILLYKDNIKKISGDRLGDNCIPLLLELSSKKDIWISLSHIPDFPKNFKAIIVNNFAKINSRSEFVTMKVRFG